MNRIARFAGGLSLLPFAALALAACTSSAPISTYGASATSPPTQAAPALAALQTRDRVVHLYGDRGAIFVSVHDDAGRLVADGVPLDALRAVDPFLYEACTSAVARGTYLDARLYREDAEDQHGNSDHVGTVESRFSK